uniref:isochorismate synthase n=1 Tax=Flavobacterium sp. TaxID=239 RepID=UPI004048F04F
MILSVSNQLQSEVFFEKVNEFQKLKTNPFTVYKKPNLNIIIGIFQKNNTLFEWKVNEPSFVISPFESTKVHAIPLNQSDILWTEFSILEDEVVAQHIEVNFDDKTQLDFENLVQNGVHAIQNQDFKKVVLSRYQEFELENLQLSQYFLKAINSYPTAFNYTLFHPEYGFWFGSTPEQLIKVENDSFTTISLAGTQVFSDSIVWSIKEQEEQAWVSRFLAETLHNFAETLHVSEPFTAKAGHLAHLKSVFSGKLKHGKSLQDLIKQLHPTPAVCGLPKEKALEFILKNENYNRSLYTGFLGEWQINANENTQQTDLFVNLRCMQLFEKQAKVYVGCGVTYDSLPASEFQETVQKSKTMLRVLFT